MGQGTSKPPPSSTEHVFTADTPVNFSPDLIEALQASPETDSTRAHDLELHIQTRVAAELARLESQTTASLQARQEELSATDDNPPETSSPDPNNKLASPETKPPDLGRQSVQKEIEKLRAKLKERKLRDDVVNDKKVESAREEVVRCLRVNDRRPLDCWREVEAFRREVGRLEGEFLGRVMQ